MSSATRVSPGPMPRGRLSARMAWSIYVSALALLASGWVYRWDSIATPPPAPSDIALPDSVERVMGVHAGGAAPLVADAPPAPAATGGAAPPPPPPAPVADPRRRARDLREAQFRQDVRAFARDLYLTGWVGANRAKYLSYVAVSEAYRRGVPPALVFGVMLVENDRFLSRAVSSAGARGLMQVMPFWVRTHGHLFGTDLTDDATNLRYGIFILGQNIRGAGLHDGLLRYNGCVRGTRTPDCFLYPFKVRRRVERYARWSCPSRAYTQCVAARMRP